MSKPKSLPMQRLDLATTHAIATKLPERFSAHYTEIPARSGVGYRVASFSKEGASYRLCVDVQEGAWWGKCECTGWPRTRASEMGRHPCKHIVGAILCQQMFSLEQYPLTTKPMEPPAEEDEDFPSDEGTPDDRDKAAIQPRSDEPCDSDAARDAPRSSRPPAQTQEPAKEEEVPDAPQKTPVQTSEPEVEVMPPAEPEQPTKPSAPESPFLDPPADASPLTRSNALVPIDPDADPLVKPVGTIEEVRKVFQAFMDAKISLLAKSDIQKAGPKNFIKKSGWRKIAVFFGLSCAKIDERYAPGTDERVWQVTYRAMARNGTYQDGTGYCSWDEAACVGRAKKGDEAAAKNEHDVRATAETRAKNRAIADLVGGGEVSAEEMKMVGSWDDK